MSKGLFILICAVLAWLVVIGIAMTSAWPIFLAIIILVCLPPRLDPAIRLKEWNEKNRR